MSDEDDDKKNEIVKRVVESSNQVLNSDKASEKEDSQELETIENAFDKRAEARHKMAQESVKLVPFMFGAAILLIAIGGFGLLINPKSPIWGYIAAIVMGFSIIFGLMKAASGQSIGSSIEGIIKSILNALTGK